MFFFSAIRWEQLSIQADTWCLPIADTTADTTWTVDTTVVTTVDMTVVITVDWTVNTTTDMTGDIPTREIMRGLALGKWRKFSNFSRLRSFLELLIYCIMKSDSPYEEHSPAQFTSYLNFS